MIFGVSLSSVVAFAQSGVVKGRILRHDGVPAAQITVTLNNSDEEVTTDNDGNFELEDFSQDPKAETLYKHLSRKYPKATYKIGYETYNSSNRFNSYKL